MDFSAATAFANEPLEIVGAGGADVKALASIGENFQRLDIVVRLARHDRVHATGSVADHSSEGAAVVAGRIGRKSKMVLFGGGTELIEDHSRLDARDAAHGIDLKNAIHILREVEDDGGITALPCERCASTASEHWSMMIATEGDRGEHIFFIAGNYDADGDLTVIRTVGCVESAASLVEADFAAKVAAQSGFERRDVELGGVSRGWGAMRHRVQNIFEDVGFGRKGRK